MRPMKETNSARYSSALQRRNHFQVSKVKTRLSKRCGWCSDLTSLQQYNNKVILYAAGPREVIARDENLFRVSTLPRSKHSLQELMNLVRGSSRGIKPPVKNIWCNTELVQDYTIVFVFINNSHVYLVNRSLF